MSTYANCLKKSADSTRYFYVEHISIFPQYFVAARVKLLSISSNLQDISVHACKANFNWIFNNFFPWQNPGGGTRGGSVLRLVPMNLANPDSVPEQNDF